jgi:hypothetical protein
LFLSAIARVSSNSASDGTGVSIASNAKVERRAAT